MPKASLITGNLHKIFGYEPHKDKSGIKFTLLIIYIDKIREPIPKNGKIKVDVNLLLIFFTFKINEWNLQFLLNQLPFHNNF